MSEPVRERRDRAEDAFAEYLERLDAEPRLSFESWAAARPEHGPELRALHAAYLRLQPHLPESGSSDAARASHGAGLEHGYELLGELGQGGFGRVYRARDRVLEREVAIKVLRDEARISPEMRLRFLAEARVLARLDHPNIVRIHAIESDEHEIRLALELVEGRTLQAIVEEDGPLSPEEAARVGIDLCRALATIHAQGLVHMDVKPGNVMRAEGGRIVLLDFGFARRTGAGASVQGSPLGGTPPFMSPEHFEERADIGPRADVYSLGVLLYWLLSRRFPYEHAGIVDLARKVLAGQVTPLLDVRSDVPAALVEIIERAMARQEAERYPSAGAMEEALRRFVGGQSRELPAESTPGRRAALVALGALGFLGVLWIGPRIGRRSFEIDYGFYKDADGGSAALASGDSVKVGDRLHMEARSKDAFYLYVFNQDEKGTWSRLLPAGDEARLNDGDTRHRFPPQGSWEVDIAGEREHLYVVASPRRVPFADELVATIDVRGVHQDAIASATRERLRGIAGVPAEPAPGAPFDLAAYFARFEQGAGSDVHTAHLDLRNEGR